MTHWQASSAAGWLLFGRYRPLCSYAYVAPDCAARRWFMAAMNRRFREPNHCQRIHDTWLIGAAVRGFDPAPITGRTKARATGY